MANQTIGAGYVKALIDLAVSKGAEPNLLLDQSHIHLVDLQNRDNRIPLDRYQTLMKAAKGILQEPALGAQLGEAAILSEISIVGLVAHAATTLAEGFLHINRYGRLVVEVDGHKPSGRFEFDRDEAGDWIVDTRQNPNIFPELTESAFAMMACWPAQVSGLTSIVKAVEFTHNEPGNHAEYERIFDAPVAFGCDRNALLIDRSMGTQSLRQNNRYVFGIFSERADELLEELQNSKSTRGQVESLLIPILHTGDVSMEQIAEKMGTSRQTLYRKLKAEDVTYEKLLDDLRQKMAVNYLSGKKASVNETAYLVGFSEPSAFSRAFKRWTGNSPGGYVPN